ncbi:STY4534 family ICE replication protein [Chitinimonas lacunae]|uniref:STY4534 family ICE replication protein n=1 Tax=Chitinimonas lacunae TaxID=1963018 RepID=A0ABV8MTR1_9NEIS
MSDSTDKTYFDLHTTGIGFLNRIREVKPKKGEAFLACDIAALTGASDDVAYVRFDTRVTGKEAQHLVRRCIQAVDAQKKVLIGFRLGDLWTDLFVHTKGKHAGEPGVSLKARLLFISFIKVDGKPVYKAEPRTPSHEDDTGAANVAAAATQALPPATTTPPGVETVDDAPAESFSATAESF